MRKLDKAVFDYLHEQRKLQGQADYDAVRGAFQQGPDLVESSAFKERSHVQIAVLNMECVLGWFLVPGDRSLLSPEELATAQAQLKDATAQLMRISEERDRPFRHRDRRIRERDRSFR